MKIIQLLTLLVLRIWLSFATLESSNCLAEKKFIYGYRCPWLRSLHDIIINGEGFFAKFCFLIYFLFPCQYWHFFFSGTHLRTCVKQVHHWILFYWTRFKIPWLRSQFVVMWITLIVFDPSVLMKASFDLSIDKQPGSKLSKGGYNVWSYSFQWITQIVSRLNTFPLPSE